MMLHEKIIVIFNRLHNGMLLFAPLRFRRLLLYRVENLYLFTFSWTSTKQSLSTSDIYTLETSFI